MAGTMTPIQTAKDILETIPRMVPCCSGTQAVEVRTLESVREAVANAADDEEILYRLLARCRALAVQNFLHARVQADTDAALGGAVHPRSEEVLQSARELLASLDARLGVHND